MGFYLALAIGGKNIKQDLQLDDDIDVELKVHVKPDDIFTINQKQPFNSYLPTIPLGLGYCIQKNKWQIKMDINASCLSFMSFDNKNIAMRDIGYIKIAIGRHLHNRFVLSGVVGYNLTYINWIRIKDNKSRALELVQNENNKTPRTLWQHNIFLGAEGQWQLHTKIYLTAAIHIGLPMLNKSTVVESRLKTMHPIGRIQIQELIDEETTNGIIASNSIGLLCGVMYHHAGAMP